MILNYSVVLGLLFALVQITVGAKDTKERYPSPRASDHSLYKRPSATRPGYVSSASNQDTLEENKPFRYPVQERKTPERQSRPIPGSLQGINQRPGLPRRPQSQPSPLRPSFQGQDLNRGTFYPQSQRPKSIAERIPQRAPAVDFKPFDNPSENIEQEGPGPLPQRPVRNPSQYGPEAVEEDFSKGFPPGFIDNLPNFNFQGNLPDAPAGESRGFLDGFSNFPNFRTVGGFDPLGPPPEDAVSGSSDSGDYRPSNLKKRNPEDNLQRPERYPSPETRDARALGYSSKIMLRRTRRDASAFPTTKTSSIYCDYLLQNSSVNYKKSKKRQFSSKSKNRYNKVKSIPQTESRNVTSVENSKDEQKFISSKDKQKTISRDHSDMAYMDEDKGDEVLLGDAFFEKETDAELDNTDTEPDNTASEQRFFPRRKNRRQNDFPSFELFRPFFDDFHAKPERPSSPPRRFRPRPPSSHEFHYDGSDNSILGSGNFIVLPGGTFKDYADYHDDYYYNNEYRPYRPEYNGDFFANFKDFADINAHRRRLINVRNDKF